MLYSIADFATFLLLLDCGIASLSWGFISLYTKAGILVSSVDLRGANIDLGEPECVTITGKNGSFFSFAPGSDAERKEWVMAIGALMQVFQSHWKAHPIVPVFELLCARVTQLWTISKSPTHSETAERLSDASMMLMVAYMWNSNRRQDRIIERLTTFIQIVKALIHVHCPVDITDALSSVAKQVVQHANLPFPSLQTTLAVGATTDPTELALSQGRSSPTPPTEYKSISFGPQKSSSKSNINDSSEPSPSYSQTITSLNLPTHDPIDGRPLSPISPSSSAGNLTLSALASPSSQASQSPAVLNSPVAGRRAHADLSLSHLGSSSGGSSNGSTSKTSTPPSLSHSSPNLTAKDGDDVKFSLRSLGNESSHERSKAEIQHQETLQEQVLRLVKDIRATFVKSVESFKSLNQKNFDKTVADAEASFEKLKASFYELLKPLESPTVVQRLRETPDKYLQSWRKAVAVVKMAFESSDRTSAMTLLRESLPGVGDDMGQASHILCGSVFEAAQQLFAEQELKGATALFFDCETSRIASFLRQVSSDNYRPTSPHSTSSSLSSGLFSPIGTPRQDYPNAVHYVPISTGLTVATPQWDEFTELVRKALLAAQTMTKICNASFFDATSHEDHEKHLSILERLNLVVDKMISDVEVSSEGSEAETQNGDRTSLIEALISIRSYGDTSAGVIETIAELDNNPRAALSTISPQKAIKSLAASRGSQQAFSSKLNSAQMRFSTAAKQLCTELERLLDLVPGAALFDESKLSKEQLKARRQSMAPVAASTHFINHYIDGPSSPQSTSNLESQMANLSVSPPASTSPRSVMAMHHLSSSSPQLPSFTVTDSEAPAQPNSARQTTWSEKIKPRASFVNPDIPQLPTQFLAGVTQNNTPSPSSPNQSSPLSPQSGSSSPRGPDSMQWRKSVKSRDDPVSPRTVSVGSSPKGEASAHQGSFSASTSPTQSHALGGGDYGQGGSSPSNSSALGGMSGMSSYGIDLSGSGSNSTPVSARSTGKNGGIMQTITVRGVSIQYPLTDNIWMEQEEGNLRFLKATEADASAASASTERTGSVASPPNSRSAASKSQSTRDLGRSGTPPTPSGTLHSSARSGHAVVKSDVPTQSPGSHKSHMKSDSDVVASKQPSSPSLNQSNGSVGGPGSSRTRLISEPLLASATLNRLIIKLTSESAVDVAFMKSFLATYRSFTTPEELWGKLLERYNVPPNVEISEEAYKQQVTLPIHLRVANVIGMWLASNYMDISDELMVHIEYFVEQTIATGEAKGLQRKLKSAVEKAQGDKKLYLIQENSKFSRVRAGGADRAKAFKQVMMTARNTRLDPFLFFNEDDIDPHLIAEQLTALDWSLFSKITNSELLNAHLMSKGTLF